MSEKLVLINPVVAMLFNNKEQKWHPIVFSASPYPGVPDPTKATRMKSRAHHTVGYEEREVALVGAHALADQIEGSAELSVDDDIQWDGEGVPALIAHLDRTSGKPRLIFL